MQPAKSKELNRLCCLLATPDIGFRKIGDDFPNRSNTFASSFESAEAAVLKRDLVYAMGCRRTTQTI